MYDLKKISHSLDSINLAGPPIAALAITPTYEMQELTTVRISQMFCHDKNGIIHTIYFELPPGSHFRGYTDLTQIGQYYSLTVNKKLTRLYTAVNFLQAANIRLMDQISKGAFAIIKHPVTTNQTNLTQ